MRNRYAAAILAIALAACGGGGDDTPASGSDLDEAPSGLPGVVNRANDIGDATTDRLAELQNQSDSLLTP